MILSTLRSWLKAFSNGKSLPRTSAGKLRAASTNCMPSTSSETPGDVPDSKSWAFAISASAAAFLLRAAASSSALEARTYRNPATTAATTINASAARRIQVRRRNTDACRCASSFA